MSYAAIAYIIPQYEDYPNQWLKAYEPATTTPKLMAIDGLGSSTSIKYELDASGFPITSGSVRLIPFIDGAYDLWLFATEADADANNTNNAIQLADNITAIASGTSTQTADVLTITEDQVTLASGQLTVVFTETNLNFAEVYVSQSGVDRGRLLKGVDYVVVNDKEITLTNSYPSGTVIFSASRSGATYYGNSINAIESGLIGDGVFDNTTAMQALINTALSSSLVIDWGDASNIFLTTGNITDLHNVKHSGYGKIKRGSDLFNPNPLTVYSESNIIYVSSSGSSTNDGLSSIEPMTYNSVRGTLTNYGPYLTGSWVFEFAAGTYSVAGTHAIRIGPDNDTGAQEQTENTITNANYVEFRGQNVGYDPATNPRPTPSVIFDGLGNPTVLFDFRSGFRSYVRDIKFINANGSASSGGILCSNGALRCENIHTSDCLFGITGFEGCQLEVKGGDIEGTPGGSSNTGIRSLFHCKHDIGNQGAGVAGQGPFIHNCNLGFFAQEGSTGHSDFVTYEDNDFGIRCRVNSRVNMNGSDFKRNTVAARSDTNSILAWDDNIVFNIGTVDENTDDLQSLSGGRILYNGSNGSELLSFSSDYQTFIKAYSIGATATLTTEQIIRTSQVPKGFLTSQTSSGFPGKSLKFLIVGDISGILGTKTIRLNIGDQGGAVSEASSLVIPSGLSGKFILAVEINLTSKVTQFYHSNVSTESSTGSQFTAVSSGSTTYDTGIDDIYDIQLTVQLSNALDSVTIDSYTAEIQGII